MKALRSNKSFGFNTSAIHTAREPHAIFYLKQRTSFWIASLSLFTFLVGNMMGQHGWYAFWASVLGKEDLSAIVYEGTVEPIEKVVDYGCWAKYGGDYKVHTFRQAPEECLRPMPQYTTAASRDDVFSMQYMSSYSATTEGTGTHAAVDIRVPVGTPVHAVMTAIVDDTGNQPSGFGNYIVLKHPNVPDPKNPSKDTEVLYSEYAHLSTVYVEKGDIVHKGDIIGLSGNSGNTTGPHLHFGISNDQAPYHPYYPSSKSDGYAYTINPLLYVQSDYAPISTQTTLVASETTTSNSAVDQPKDVVAPRRVSVSSTAPVVATPDPAPETMTTIIARLQARRDARLRERLASRQSRQAIALQTGLTNVLPSAPEQTVHEVAAEQTVTETSGGHVDTVEIIHDGHFTGRGWEKVRITLLDADGNVVTTPRLDHDIALRTDFGTAEFRPSTLTSFDFDHGVATVNVLPRGRRTVVIKVMPYNVISQPMEYER